MFKILVVEDERDIQDVVAYNLQQAGYEVLTAGRGDEGLRLAKSQRPDLVLLDVMLPGLSGKEVCQEIRRDTALAGMIIIMVSAKGEEIDRVIGFEAEVRTAGRGAGLVDFGKSDYALITLEKAYDLSDKYNLHIYWLFTQPAG